MEYTEPQKRISVFFLGFVIISAFVLTISKNGGLNRVLRWYKFMKYKGFRNVSVVMCKGKYEFVEIYEYLYYILQ